MKEVKIKLKTRHKNTTKDDRLEFYKLNINWQFIIPNNSFRKEDIKLLTARARLSERGGISAHYKTLKGMQRDLEEVYKNSHLKCPQVYNLQRNNIYSLEGDESFKGFIVFRYLIDNLWYLKYIGEKKENIPYKEITGIGFDTRKEALDFFAQWSAQYLLNDNLI